uniref:Secreted protein n=1 Tax=Trichogramma kaykai TaxID=54128 RepID=A0ABD2X7G0_9HYME
MKMLGRATRNLIAIILNTILILLTCRNGIVSLRFIPCHIHNPVIHSSDGVLRPESDYFPAAAQSGKSDFRATVYEK